MRWEFKIRKSGGAERERESERESTLKKPVRE